MCVNEILQASLEKSDEKSTHFSHLNHFIELKI